MHHCVLHAKSAKVFGSIYLYFVFSLLLFFFYYHNTKQKCVLLWRDKYKSRYIFRKWLILDLCAMNQIQGWEIYFEFNMNFRFETLQIKTTSLSHTNNHDYIRFPVFFFIYSYTYAYSFFCYHHSTWCLTLYNYIIFIQLFLRQ